MELKIRPMQPGDITSTRRLWESMAGIALSGADEPQQLLEFLHKNAGTCFVATTDDQVIGTVGGGSNGRRSYLYHLAVDARFQRQGIGRSLMDRCLEAFRQAGPQKSHLFVVQGNEQGLRFWQRVGWKKRDDIVVMSMDLL